MIGAIIGDIVGAPYEFNNIRTKDFPLFCSGSEFTDDTVMSVAVARALLKYESVDESNAEDFKKTLIDDMHSLGKKYYDAGYGGRFFQWLIYDFTEPYNSFGNGSAMRVSPVVWYAKSLDEAIFLAKTTAEITHNHPEGIKGAVVTAGAAFLARSGEGKEKIKSFIEQYYVLDRSLDEIRPVYKFNETCQGSVPEAMQAFLESESYEDAIRNAISIGGDSDTIAAITGCVAEAYYGVDEALALKGMSYLEKDLFDTVDEFRRRYVVKSNG